MLHIYARDLYFIYSELISCTGATGDACLRARVKSSHLAPPLRSSPRRVGVAFRLRDTFALLGDY